MKKDSILLINFVNLGQINAVKELIKSTPNLDLDEKDSYGNFATIIAAQRNDLPMLMFLVINGAKLDLEDGRGRTVEGWAHRHKNNDMIKFIKESKTIHFQESVLGLQAYDSRLRCE